MERQTQFNLWYVIFAVLGVLWLRDITEISAHGDNAHVKATNARFEDGKLTSEAFEGDLRRPPYDQLVSHAQHYFLGQTAVFLKSLALLLPFSWKPPSDRD